MTSDLAFAALADPTRRAIVARLANGETTAGEIARPFSMSQPAISHHLKVLEEAGIIARRVDGARRPCRLVTGALAEIEDWLALLRVKLEANYDRLDTLLTDMADTEHTQKETDL
jgi:DNA-binding transcriptional ArsR family regulator